jgi:hypothetical protein
VGFPTAYFFINKKANKQQTHKDSQEDARDKNPNKLPIYVNYAKDCTNNLSPE